MEKWFNEEFLARFQSDEEFRLKVFEYIWLKTEYEETRNPLYVWKALEVAVRHGFGVTDWCRDYLLEALPALLEAGKQLDQVERANPSDALARTICQALRLNVRTYAHFDRKSPRCMANWVVQIDRRRKESKRPLTAIIEEMAAEMGMSSSKLTKLYYEGKRRTEAAENRLRNLLLRIHAWASQWTDDKPHKMRKGLLDLLNDVVTAREADDREPSRLAK